MALEADDRALLGGVDDGRLKSVANKLATFSHPAVNVLSKNVPVN